ncbi:MAG: hypothetical protein P4L83_02930 [Nevskia sp.]|nr:hypothetical protein [Nevskia sp.]
MIRRLACICCLWTFVTACRADPLLWIEPVSQNIPVGSDVTITLGFRRRGGDPALAAYDVTVLYDPQRLSYSGTSFGSQLDQSGRGSFRLVRPGRGSVDVVEASLDPQDVLAGRQGSSFILVALKFSTLAQGRRIPVTLSAFDLEDASGAQLGAELGGAWISIGPPADAPPGSQQELSGAGSAHPYAPVKTVGYKRSGGS